MRIRFGVIADIHGNAPSLEAVLAHAERQSIDRLVNLGDVLYGPLMPLETYRILQQAPVVATVSGNQDRLVCEATQAELDRNRTLAFVHGSLGSEPIAWLRTLPATALVDEEMFLCHGSPGSDTTYLLEDVSSGVPVVRPEGAILELLGDVKQTLILCGHSHIPRVVQLATGQLIVNPGSVGLPAYDDDQPVKHVMETFAPHASYAIVEKVEWGWAVSLFRVPYAWERAAERARGLGRDDWARAIATGRAT